MKRWKGYALGSVKEEERLYIYIYIHIYIYIYIYINNDCEDAPFFKGTVFRAGRKPIEKEARMSPSNHQTQPLPGSFPLDSETRRKNVDDHSGPRFP